MTSNELQEKLASDVEACSGLPWPKDFSAHLMTPPRLEKFDESGHQVEMWLVFDEQKDSPSQGYLILVDPESKDYCLAVKGAKTEGLVGTVIGHYGETLREAIEGM
jgi:hypothetical protein